jgi:hypothetical protein
MSNDAFEIDTRKLDKILKALKGKQPVGRVGILGDKTKRKDHDTNASIGAKHEFGDSTMPQRSFLRLPIKENLQKYLDGAGAFDKESLNNVIKTGSIEVWIKRL